MKVLKEWTCRDASKIWSIEARIHERKRVVLTVYNTVVFGEASANTICLATLQRRQCCECLR